MGRPKKIGIVPDGSISDIELENVEEVEDVVEEESQQAGEVEVPTYLDEGWTEYVLSQLKDSEKENGCPKVHGLRRIIEKVFGKVTSSNVKIVATSPDFAACEYSLTVWDGLEEFHYTACADAGGHNLTDVFKKYPTAMAETRAEGRALRKIMRLNVVSAEELTETNSLGDKVVDTDNEPINKHQIAIINTLAKRVNVNVADACTKILEREVKCASDIGVSVSAQLIIKTLNTYQQDKDKIPEEIKNFTQNLAD